MSGTLFMLGNEISSRDLQFAEEGETLWLHDSSICSLILNMCLIWAPEQMLPVHLTPQGLTFSWICAAVDGRQCTCFVSFCVTSTPCRFKPRLSLPDLQQWIWDMLQYVLVCHKLRWEWFDCSSYSFSRLMTGMSIHPSSEVMRTCCSTKMNLIRSGRCNLFTLHKMSHLFVTWVIGQLQAENVNWQCIKYPIELNVVKCNETIFIELL